MAVINTGDFQSAMRPIFGKYFNQHTVKDIKYDKVFTPTPTNTMYNQFPLVSSLGVGRERPEGSNTKYDVAHESWTKYIRIKDYSNGTILSANLLREPNFTSKVMDAAQELKRTALQTREMLASTYLDGAFTTSIGGDGVAMCSTAHPNEIGTYSNDMIAADLTEDNIAQMVINIRNFTDPRGLRNNVNARKLVVPNSTAWFDATRILNSKLRVGTTDNDMNVLKDDNLVPEGIVCWSYLTDPNAYFMLTDAPKGLCYFHIGDIRVTTDTAFDNDNVKFKYVFRADATHINPQGIMGSQGD